METSSAEFVSQSTELQADFQRIADRAPWVRAGFTVKAGKFGLFCLGPLSGDGPDAALIRGLPGDQDAAIISELYALTDQAGALAAEIWQSRRYQGKAFSAKSVHYDLNALWEFWLMLLLHTPPVCFHCKAKGPDGGDRLATPQLGDNEVAVWIDAYAQVCVSALAWLKANSSAAPGGQQQPEDEKPGPAGEKAATQSDAWLSVPELAHHYSVKNQEALRKVLDRWRKAHHLGSGWMKMTEGKPREPKYLYHLSAVKPVIEDWIASDQSSGQRPAK